MPYRYVDELTVADVGFQAWGDNLEELFYSAWQATLQVMIEDPSILTATESRAFTLEEPSLDLLLYNFLQELIYYKDAEGLLLRIEECRIRFREQEAGPAGLQARASGQAIDPEAHRLGTDVKAVTFYNFNLQRDSRGWSATVVLDV